MLPVSLECLFLIVSFVFPNVYLSCVLCTLCCQVLGIVYFWLSLWYSLTFICLVSCVPYVARFSGMSIFDCPLVFPNVYLSCVLCTLCCQFLWNVYFWLPLVFPNVYLSCVLCILCSQFLWNVYFWLPLWYSVTFICLVSCVPYVASFSRMSIFDCPIGFP